MFDPKTEKGFHLHAWREISNEEFFGKTIREYKCVYCGKTYKVVKKSK